MHRYVAVKRETDGMMIDVLLCQPDISQCMIVGNVGPVSFTRLSAICKSVYESFVCNQWLREKVALHYGGLSKYVFCGLFCTPISSVRDCAARGSPAYRCMGSVAIKRLRYLEMKRRLPVYHRRLKLFPRIMKRARLLKYTNFGTPWTLAEFFARARTDEVYKIRYVLECRGLGAN